MSHALLLWLLRPPGGWQGKQRYCQGMNYSEAEEGGSLPVSMCSKEGEIHVSSVTLALLIVPYNLTVLKRCRWPWSWGAQSVRSDDTGSTLSIMAEELRNRTLGRSSDLLYLFRLQLCICETKVIILRVVPRIKQKVQNIRHGSRHRQCH